MKLNQYFETNGVMKKFFANSVGISAATLNNLLNGEYLPNLKTAIEIERFTKQQVSVYDWTSAPNPYINKSKEKK